MPRIEDVLQNRLNLSGMKSIDPPKPPVSGVVPNSPMNSYTRCPVPQIGIVSPDTLDQSDRKGAVPQYRVFIK